MTERGFRSGVRGNCISGKHMAEIKRQVADLTRLAKELRGRLQPPPPALRKTMTYDQSKEMSYHPALTPRTGVAIFFTDPHSPWQRGSNENTNGLLRQ